MLEVGGCKTEPFQMTEETVLYLGRNSSLLLADAAMLFIFGGGRCYGLQELREVVAVRIVITQVKVEIDLHFFTSPSDRGFLTHKCVLYFYARTDCVVIECKSQITL